MSPADPLNADALSAAFPDHEIVVLAETTSTNDVAFEMAVNGVRRAIVFAERQTAGRGQHGNRWESAARKGLWFSMLLEEPIEPNESSRVTCWAADLLAATVNNQFSLDATVKPPNDVYAGGRKIAGVLLELRAITGRSHASILGIGINVDHTAADFSPELRERAASIAMLTGERVGRTSLAIELLRRLSRGHPREPVAINTR